MEEDEDVILEGTSLHQYLQEVGFTDFEVISSQNKSKELMKDVKELEKNKSTGKKNRVFTMPNVIHKILGLANAEDLLLKSLGSRLISTRLLEEEDLLILETLSPSIERLSSDPKLIQSYMSKEGSTESITFSEYFSISATTFYLWGSIVAVILSLNLFGDFALTHCLCMWGVALLVVFLARYFYLSKYELCRSELEKTLFIIEKSNSVSRRCLKFLNELNILRKGLNQKTSLLVMSECRYENGLSEGVCSLLNSLSSLLKSGHSQLLHFSLCSSQNINSLFDKRFDSDENSTDQDFSYSSLKTKRNMTAVLSSSFLTELFLCFEYSRNTSVFRLIPHAKYDLIKLKTEWLERVVRFSQKTWLNEEPILNNIVQPQKSYENVKWDVMGAIDVLSVRCRIVAYSGTYLKEIWAQDYVKEDAEVLHENVQRTCEDIRHELVSCDACLEEVVERTRNHFGRNRGNDSLASEKLSEHYENRKETSLLSDGIPAQLYGLKERVIEDEVFEAVVDDRDELKKTNTHIDEVWLQTFETEKRTKKKQKERCKRVLQEIQPILQKRRQMWLDRESKALRRMELNRNEVQVELNSQQSPISSDSGLSSPMQGVASPFEINSPGNLPLIVAQNDAVQNYLKINTVLEKSGPIPVMSTTNDGENSEYDSEEERLLLYKKVKKELDEDEAMRKDESEDEETENEENQDSPKRRGGVNRKGGFRLPLPPLKGFKLVEGNATIIDNEPLVYHSSIDNQIEHECGDAAPHSTLADAHEKSGTKPKSEISTSKFAHLAAIFGASSGYVSPHFDPANGPTEDGESFDESHSSPELNSATSSFLTPSPDLTKDRVSMTSMKEQESESVCCGDTDEEDERVLDWTSCGFTTDRKTAISGIGFCGLPSALTSGPLREGPLVGGEEVFGGVGEGASESEENSGESDEE